MSAQDTTTDAYKRGVKVMGVGIAATGLLTFAYFSAAGHALSASEYGRISTLWAVLFVVMSVLYRPVEQLLSRRIADRLARGGGPHALRTPVLLQLGFAALFVVLALVFRGPIEHQILDGEDSLYWILVFSALAYAASYFARGYLAGHQWFALYGGLVFFEASARLLFPLAVLVGIGAGQTAVALGILAAPVASLLVVPVAIARHRAAEPTEAVDVAAASSGDDARFAGSVAIVQLAEQTLLNVAVLLAGTATEAGLVFSALLIVRAPLQLFQAIQTSLLPHLAGLEATEGKAAFSDAITKTVRWIAGFAGLVTAGLLVVGPWSMEAQSGHQGRRAAATTGRSPCSGPAWVCT